MPTRNIARCAPGGKATSRKLKELLAEIAAPAALRLPRLRRSPPPRRRCRALPHERFPARLRAARPSIAAARRRTPGSSSSKPTAPRRAFEVGDSLGVVARNCPELVAAIIARLGVDGGQPGPLARRDRAAARRGAVAGLRDPPPLRPGDRGAVVTRPRHRRSRASCRRWPRATPAPGRKMRTSWIFSKASPRRARPCPS